jgi:hypothetical protein
MATPTPIRPTSKNYLGNSSSSKMEVHDLRLETSNCQIAEIVAAGNAVTFNPDTLQQARSEGYDNCHFCLGSSKR